jgi:hypothetical protein
MVLIQPSGSYGKRVISGTGRDEPKWQLITAFLLATFE